MKGQILKLAVITVLIFSAFYFLSGPGQAQYGITIPKIKALYEDNLQGKITSSATSMTLVRGTDKQERNLSGTYGFVIDEGSTIEEFVICSASGTALTNCLRGIDVENGKSEVATLKEEHRRGASVKISNYPQLAIISRILNGDEDLPNLLTYTNQEIGRDSSATSTAIMDKGYMDSLAISGSPTSTYFQIGMVMLASRTQTASTTASSTTGAPLVLPAANSSSTPNLRFKGIVPVTEDDGYLSQLWLDLSEPWIFSGNVTTTGQLEIDGILQIDGNATSSGIFAFTGDLKLVNASTSGTLNIDGALCFGNDCQNSTWISHTINDNWDFTYYHSTSTLACATYVAKDNVGYTEFTSFDVTASCTQNMMGVGSDQKWQMDNTNTIAMSFRLRQGDETGQHGIGIASENESTFFESVDHKASSKSFFGFVFAAGESACKTSQNNSSTITTTTASITLTNWNTYSFVYTPSVDLKCYVNGVLDATITTTLPGEAGIGYFGLGANLNTDTTDISPIKFTIRL